uniref:Uncharacterized protein n=1 Tax=Oryza rufipogon TaxID=4529 RepID=A0A0E0PXN7_ORYRU
MPIRTSRRHSPPVLPLMSRRLAVSQQAGSFSNVLRHCGRCYLKLFKACIRSIISQLEKDKVTAETYILWFISSDSMSWMRKLRKLDMCLQLEEDHS